MSFRVNTLTFIPPVMFCFQPTLLIKILDSKVMTRFRTCFLHSLGAVYFLKQKYFERVAQVDKSVLFIKNFTKDVTEKDITALSKDIEEVQLRTIFSKKVDNQRCAFFSGLIICISFLSGKEAHTPLGNIKTGIFCKKIGAGTHRLKLFVFIFSDEIFDLVPSIHY